MRAKRNYTLYKRALSNGTTIWYYRYYEGGVRIAKSTGKASREAAVVYVEDILSRPEPEAVKKADPTIQETAPVKRGRGRPRKIPDTPIQETAPVKRGRGRPRKIPDTPIQETTAPAKRERPKKAAEPPAPSRGRPKGSRNKVQKPKKKVMKFAEYAEDWWLWDKCEYVLNKRATGTPSKPGIKQSYVDTCHQRMIHHVLPYFGRYRLDQITSDMVNSFVIMLSKEKKLAAKTVNSCRGVLFIMMKEAKRKKLITENPVEGTITMTVEKKKKKLLTDEECAMLFDQENLKKLWKDDFLSYSCSYIASLTGMRAGELLALTIDDITTEVIHVKKGYIAKYGINTTKTSEVRDIPITKEMYLLMYTVYNSHPHPSGKPKFIFSLNGDIPFAENRMRENFYRALTKMGISKEERLERGINFHAWRHKFTTDCVKANMHPEKIRALTGHKSEEMLTTYTDLNACDLSEQVNQIQASRQISKPKN